MTNGQKAYEAFNSYVYYVAWDKLTTNHQEAWEDAAKAVMVNETEWANKYEAIMKIHKHASDCLGKCFQEAAILPNFCRIGEDIFDAAVRLAKAYRDQVNHTALPWDFFVVWNEMYERRVKELEEQCSILQNQK